MNSRLMRNGFIYLLIVVAVLAIFFTLFSDVGGSQEIPIGTAVEMIKKGEVEMVEVRGDQITLYTTRQETFNSRMEQYAVFVDLLQSFEVDPQMTEINVRGSSGLGSFFGLILNFLPLIFFGAVLLFMMRQAQGNTNQTFSFGRSKARMLVGNQPNVTFDDVAGAEESKEELQEVVEFLQFPERFESLGARVPRGVLLDVSYTHLTMPTSDLV